MRRLSAVFMAFALASVLVVPASGMNAPRLPRDAADWATFSVVEQVAAVDYQWRLLRRSIADGSAVVHTVTAAPAVERAVAPAEGAVAVTATAICSVQWIDQLGGSWVRGGGWTDTSENVYRIYASRSAKQGQFLKDGVLKGNWYHEIIGGASHAESWTAYDFKWAFESFNYTVKGWHGAQVTNGGAWLIGPDAYCTLTVQH